MAKKKTDLENEETWDFEGAERRSPVTNRRAIVSVAIPSEELSEISQAAVQAEMRVSEFIRSAAVEKARHGVLINRGGGTISLGSAGRVVLVTETQVAGVPSQTFLMEATG